MSNWNYRVLLSKDQSEYFIGEVYYDDDGQMGWVENDSSRLRWDDYDDLQGTVEMIREAFNKPILAVLEDDALEEILPVYAAAP